MDVDYLRQLAAPRLRKFYPKIISLDFSGSSPPELFVGEAFYPKVYAGILAPTTHDRESGHLTSPEYWFQERLKIEDILFLRCSLIHSRFTVDVKQGSGKLLNTLQEVSMASKPTSVEFVLKKKPKLHLSFDMRHAPVGNPAPLVKAMLEENPVIAKPVEKAVSDSDLKAADAMQMLYQKDISVTHIMKLLSAGVLGVKLQRKLTPTKWGITAVDSLLSKSMMEQIRDYPWIDAYQVFSASYLGNHYEILLLPRHWSFEVIEHSLAGPACPQGGWWTDYEGCWNRKMYAGSVVGAYYANRLAVTEYLTKIQRQASVLIFREVSPEYWAPCGVGILREATRHAFTQLGRSFSTLQEALQDIQTRLKQPIINF
ncbi:MAG: hypothetical protein AABX86_00680, partial [Nanoarchaeota archaeon]